MSFDIRKTKQPEQAPETSVPQEDPQIAWLRANRHLLGPFKSGTVLEGSGTNFKSVNIREDDEVKNAKAIAEAEAKVDANTVMPKTKPVSIPQPVNFDDLPEEKKRAIMRETEASMSKLKTPEHKPSMPVTDEKSKLPNPGLPDGMQFDFNIKEFLDKQSFAEPEEASKEALKETASAGGLPEALNCQHCGWELTKADPGAVDEVDKLNFIQAVLGQISFVKSYEMLGGRVSVTFRTLTSEEADMTFTQVAWDAGRGEILDEGQYFRTLTDYRMVLSLSKFRTLDGVTISLPDNVNEWETEKIAPKATKLTHIVPWMYENVLKVESVRRAVAAAFFRFQRMVERMEAHFDDPDFWPAIEKQP